MFAQNGRVRIYYELAGTPGKQPLLFINGLSRNIPHFRELCDELAAHFHVIAFDNRGVGKSGTPLPPYTTPKMAADAVAVLDHAGIARTHVFGFSLGGMIAQELSVRHPHRVERLVLGGTRAARSAGASMKLEAMAQLVLAGRFTPDQAAVQTARYVLSEAFMQKRPEVLEAWARAALSEPPRKIGVFGQMLAALAHDTVGRLHRIPHPTLVLTGEADRLMPPECSHYLARSLPNAELEVIPGAGHEFPIELPAQTAASIARFCQAPSRPVADNASGKPEPGDAMCAPE